MKGFFVCRQFTDKLEGRRVSERGLDVGAFFDYYTANL